MVALAGAPAKSATARRRAVGAAFREVSEYLGNTPAVAKASYVDPRVVDLYHSGVTIAAALPGPPGELQLGAGRAQEAAERAVLELLRDRPS